MINKNSIIAQAKKELEEERRAELVETMKVKLRKERKGLLGWFPWTCAISVKRKL